LESLCREAALHAIVARDIENSFEGAQVSRDDFDAALKKARPSIQESTLEQFNQ
jgi:SpoVK/Ycf46/Vps4 family AAA+-type ATPase